MRRLEAMFRTPKPLIAMLHFPALPGRPRHDPSTGMDHLVDRVGHDLTTVQAAGVDGVLFCNEADIPYQLVVGAEIPAAMAAVIGQLKADVDVPFGVNVLWDARATLALARATGAAFAREVFTGTYESDFGLMQPNIGELSAYRVAIGAANVAVFDNISPEFSSPLGSRSIADRARSAAFLGMDALLVSGPMAGTEFAMEDLRAAKVAVPEVAVIANTGVRPETVGEVLAVADGAIVGTSLKRDGCIWNEVDASRVERLMEAVRRARARPVVV